MNRCQAVNKNGKRCKMKTPGKLCHIHIHRAIKKSLKKDKPRKIKTKKSLKSRIKNVFKKKKGPKGILKKPGKTKKKGRFFVKKASPERSVKFDDPTARKKHNYTQRWVGPVGAMFPVNEKIIKIRANDCKRLDRPKLRKVKMTKEEQMRDMRRGVPRNKKYKKMCRKEGQRVYITRNGYDCCKTFNKDKK